MLLPALAQQPQGPAQADVPSGVADLVVIKSVQKDLDVTAHQRNKIQAALQKARAKHQEDWDKIFRPAPGAPVKQEDYVKLLRKVDRESTKALGGIFKPEQARRLQQIALQRQGIFALQNKEVAKALALTKEQSRKVKALGGDLTKAAREMLQSAAISANAPTESPKTSAKEAADKVRKLCKEAADKVPSLLTPKQRKKWEEMTGKPFEPALDLPSLTSPPDDPDRDV
jgi:Spy/CpxP family protein refolding chaperone